MSVVRRIAQGENHRSASVLNRPTDDILTLSGCTLGETFPGFATPTTVATATTAVGVSASFAANGTITETRSDGVVITTAFNADGSMTRVVGAPVSKTITTTFTASGVTEVVT